MSEPLLAVDKLEVVYQRAITAVQGVSLVVPARPDRRRCSAPTAPARPRRCAPSPASSASTMRGSPKAASRSRAGASRTGRRNEIARRGIALVPERDKVFPNLTVAENLAAPVAPRLVAAERRRREALVYQFFPRSPTCAQRIGGLLSGGERQMLAIGSALVCRARAAARRRAVARPRARRGRGPGAAPRRHPPRPRHQHPARRAERRRRRSRSPTTATSWRTAASCSTATRAARGHGDIQEFYLGQTGGDRRSYRAVKQYRRTRRWYG